MPFTPDPPFPKSRGDAIKSSDWNALATEVQRLDTMVPLGAVIPWWRPAAAVPLPAGFEVCDGRTLTAAQHGFKVQTGAALNQSITLPDLRNAFVLGASAAAADGAAGRPVDQATGAPGIGGSGGSNAPRPTDHHHSVALNHTHAATSTGNASRARVGATALATDTQGGHSHKVSRGGNIGWSDGHFNNTTVPTLTDPKADWVPVLPEHYTDPVGGHAHNLGGHDHDMTHTHDLAAQTLVGAVRSGGVEAGEPHNVDPVPRYVGLLYIIRVK